MKKLLLTLLLSTALFNVANANTGEMPCSNTGGDIHRFGSSGIGSDSSGGVSG